MSSSRHATRVLMMSCAVLAACAVSAPAATIVVPPVTISRLSHSVSDDTVYDAIPLSDPSVASQGFAAAVAIGDTIHIRFQAPAGKKFVVHGEHGQPGFLEEFFVDAYWQGGPYDLVLQVSPYRATFVDPHGAAPALDESLIAVSTGARVLFSKLTCRVEADFDFTALDVTIVAANPRDAQAYSYSSVQGWVTPGFGTKAPTPDAMLMEIVDAGVVPTQATSWGQLKIRYR